MNVRDALTPEARAAAAEKTVEILKARVRALYAGECTSMMQRRIDRSRQRQEAARERRKLMLVRADELARHSEKLEREVLERTRDIRTILDNVTSGFLVVGPDLMVRPGHTVSCHALLEAPALVSRSLLHVPRLDERAGDQLGLAIEQVFSGVFPDEVSLAMVPQRFEVASRVLRMDARVLREERTVIALLLTVTDATSLELAQRQAHMNQVLVGILRQRSAFQHFTVDAKMILSSARDAVLAADQVYVRRAVHTLKGNGAAFDLDELVDVIHNVEALENIGVAELHRIEQALVAFLTAHETVLGISYSDVVEESYEVSGAAMDELDVVTQSRDVDRVERWTKQLVLKRADLVAGPLGLYVGKLAERLEKEVDFVFTGAELLVDARALRPVFSNLTHAARNALDHGVELAAERGDKPRRGRIELTVAEQSGAWVVALSDDGRGIDPELVARAAVERGFASAEAVATMTDEEKTALVFMDGLSTARAATEVSGRGIGMAAIKAAVEESGGAMEIISVRGRGTTVRVTIPNRIRREAPRAAA